MSEEKSRTPSRLVRYEPYVDNGGVICFHRQDNGDWMKFSTGRKLETELHSATESLAAAERENAKLNQIATQAQDAEAVMHGRLLTAEAALEVANRVVEAAKKLDWLSDDVLDRPGMKALHLALLAHLENPIRSLAPAQEQTDMNPTEALYLFCGWLTSRTTVTEMGSSKDAAPVPPLIEEFRNRYGLPQVTEQYPNFREAAAPAVPQGAPEGSGVRSFEDWWDMWEGAAVDPTNKDIAHAAWFAALATHEGGKAE